MINRKLALVSVLAVVIISIFYFSNFTITPVQRVMESNKVAGGSAQNTGSENDQPMLLFAADAASSTGRQAEKSAVSQEDGSVMNAAGTQAKEADKSSTVSNSQVQLKNNTGSASRGTDSTPDIYLKKGDENSKVKKLQEDLKTLGYFNASPTGYFGDITFAAVKKLQGQYNLKQDGIVHISTLALINKLVNEKEKARKASKNQTKSKVSEPAEKAKPAKPANISSRGKKAEDYMMPWFGGVENLFGRGETATVYDIQSGKSFKIKRTYGYNHADCETLTSEDTKIMKQIYGGQWSWARRPIIVTVDGRKIAASMAGMPHAGVDSKPANVYVSWRSGDFGDGTNLDTVKGNGMDGHFDIHFLNSRTHGTNKVNADHQNAVKKAAAWAEKNY